MADRDAPIFLVRLRATPGTDAVRALRAALKLLLRRFGLRCVGVAQEGRVGDRFDESQ